MSNLKNFLDKKQGKFIGRVYLLIILFVCNAAVAYGAALYFTFFKTPFLMIFGIVGTVVIIAILSTPCQIDKE